MDHHEAIVIGGGISGLAALKTLRQKGIDCILYEANEYHGGLWHYSTQNYGVMDCTHITYRNRFVGFRQGLLPFSTATGNVSKYNYAFSDFPFPAETPDYPHHSQMAAYIDRYVEHFQLYNHIHYRTKVLSVSRDSKSEKWNLVCDSKMLGKEFSVTCEYLVIATGHHAKPKPTEFPGQQNFSGTILHSVDYKDVYINSLQGKNIVVVGIGNSAVDVAVNCVARGGCKNVYLSTRSGAWIIPNYVFGQPTDLYASRFLLDYLPFTVRQFILEMVVTLLSGSPKRWNLNPKMGALQTQPTVSPTLIHHIQRGNVKVAPNIREICESSVRFHDGSIAHDIDAIIYCTGYSIDLPFLPADVQEQVLDLKTNELKLYKNVFSPSVGPKLSFLGFVQPASGGILSMSELQSQWLATLIKGRCKLPSAPEMKEDIIKDREKSRQRYYRSERHTIQQDPIVYNDEIASLIGAKPELADHPTLAHRLLLGSGGVAQWTLQGPFFNENAKNLVRAVPLPSFSVYVALFSLFLLLYIFYSLLSYLSSLVF